MWDGTVDNAWLARRREVARRMAENAHVPQWEIEEAVLKDAQHAFEAAERERLEREAIEGAAS